MKRLVPACGLAICLISSGCIYDPSWPLHRVTWRSDEIYYAQHGTFNPPPEPAVDVRGEPLTRAELTPDGRWIKKIDIRSEPQGARIMVSGFYVGETPMMVPISSTPDGRFRRTTKIRLVPTEAGGRVHGEVYAAGARIPSRLAFDAQAVPVGW